MGKGLSKERSPEQSPVGEEEEEEEEEGTRQSRRGSMFPMGRSRASQEGMRGS